LIISSGEKSRVPLAKDGLMFDMGAKVQKVTGIKKGCLLYGQTTFLFYLNYPFKKQTGLVFI
jgi:hypothetical protein